MTLDADNLQRGVGNTHAERTLEQGLRVLVDWVSCTFPVNGEFDDVKALLGLEKLEMEYHDWGRDTFREHIRFSNIVIQRKQENVYQLSLSGQGCREFETLSSLDLLTVIELLKNIVPGKFTRLDLAIDDFAGYYNVSKIRSYMNDLCFVSRIRDWKIDNEKDVQQRLMMQGK